MITMEPTYLKKRNGFTLIELLVVVATVALLAAMLLPALAQTKTKSHGLDCMNNQRQLVLAAKLYAEDNQDNWVPNQPGLGPGWVAGGMNFTAANTDNTNAAKLVDLNQGSVMGPYARNPSIYHCPEDYSKVPGEGDRVRSVSMSQTVGTCGAGVVGGVTAGSPVTGQWTTGNNTGNTRQIKWRTYGKTSSMTIPGASMLFVFLDEHPNSINDPQFAVDMADTGPAAKIIDCPAYYHNGAAGFSFADGHAELHKWLGSIIKPPVNFTGGSIILGNGGSGNNAGFGSAADMAWLQAHSSAPTPQFQ
jgi:prepilin-type N-terminal cleavage/methylation domain-containing protein/prepilin-type processing-associated H-X9-DG protein